MTTEERERSAVLSPRQVDDLRELRTLFRPTETLAVLDDFGKWLFGSAAAVGSLGAGFSASRLSHLTGAGQRIFAAAIICLALSLATAALARIPQRKHIHRGSMATMRRALDEIVRWRYRCLFIAAILLAVALVLAAIAPLFS